MTSIGSDAFYGCTSLTSITIPDGVTSIDSRAFEGCTSLASITIPDSVTSIGSDTFSGCRSLTSITIPDGVTSIGNYAFYGCTGLTSITIPDSVTSIGHYAFYNCTGLTSIKIPRSVRQIESYAFADCSGLTSIYYCGTPDEWNTIPKMNRWDDRIGTYTMIYHVWNEGMVTTPPTHLTLGVKTFTCTECDATKTEEIAKLTEHTFGDWETHDDTQHKHICECGEVEYAGHAYDNDQDTDCDLCGEVREIVTEQITDEESATGGQTSANEDSATKSEKPNDSDEQKSGCGATLTSGFGLTVLLMGAAFGVSRKKKKQ